MRSTSFDGTEIAYEEAGDGDPVVLAHGFASDSFINWIRPGIVDALTDAGFRAITYDARGHGASGKPHDPEAYADGAMARDVRALVDHLGVSEGFHLVGYSMGAFTTMDLLATDPTGVRRAVLGGVGAAMLDRDPRRGEALADALVTSDKSSITNEIARSFRDFADLTGADREALAAIQRADRPRPERLEEIRVPVLVLAGSDDPMAGSPEGLAERIPGARAKVVGGTHLNVINNPAFRDALVGFLQGDEGPSPHA